MATTKAKSEPTDKEREAQWRAESDFRTLCEAVEIKKDSKRHAAAIKCGKEELAKAKEAIKDASEKDSE